MSISDKQIIEGLIKELEECELHVESEGQIKMFNNKSLVATDTVYRVINVLKTLKDRVS